MRRTIEKIKERKGITLIALVVTIVVILILAGITVGMVTSDNGILKETKNAKQQAEIDNEKSIVERAKMLAMMRSKNGAITYDIFEPALKDEAGKMSTDVSDAGDIIEVLFTDSNRYYEVDKDGNVSEPQEVVKDEYAGDITKGGRCDGSEEKPYEINCIEDLAVFSNMTNGTGIKLENGQAVTITRADTFQNKNVILTRNLNFKSKYSYANSERTDFGNLNNDDTDGNGLITEMTTGTGFVPIGYDPSYFKGNFDGRKNTIYNLYISNFGEEKNRGLFGTIYGNAHISNLIITGTIDSNWQVAGIAGYCGDNINIKNCINKVKLTGENAAGGIAGFASGASIENCKNYGQIKIVDGYYSYTGAGGIAGSGVRKIENCQNYGKVTGTKQRLGGILAYQGGETNINNCHNYGNVISNDISLVTGGIVGIAENTNGTILNCINEGEISGNGIKGGIVGVIAGSNWNNATSEINIENCFNKENINSTNSYAGGIIGRQGTTAIKNYLYIKNSYNIGNIKGKISGDIIGEITTDTRTDTKTEFTNVYYPLEPAIGTGSLTSGEATLKTEKEIKSQAFVDLLNSNIGTNTDWKKWKIGSDGYPTFVE